MGFRVKLAKERIKCPSELLPLLKGRMRNVMGRIGAEMVRSVHLNFAHQEAPDGTKWQPLKPETIKRKGSSRILFDKGHLLGSIQVVSLSWDHVSVGPASGTEHIKAIVHQLIGVGKAKVKRPFLGFSKKRKDVERYRKVIKTALAEVAQEFARK